MNAETSAPVRHLFPKIPERDEHGNACLYPGFTRFIGVAGLFNTPHGQVVVLAPSFEALDEQCRYMNLSGAISKDKCVITEGRRVE